MPAVALSIPPSEMASLVSPVTARLVVVALVEVEFVVMRLLMVDDAETAIPIVVVGESAPLVIAQSRNDEVR